MIEGSNIIIGNWLTVLALSTGFAVIALIDKLVPEYDNPHEFQHTYDEKISKSENLKLMRMGLFSTLAIAIQQLP